MSLRTKYFMFIALVHLMAILPTFWIFSQNKLAFIAAEFIVLCSLYYSYKLFYSLISPIKLISTGTNAIMDGDFNVKFEQTGQPEMDQLIDTYNRMIDQLRRERTENVRQHFFLEKLIQSLPSGVIILNLDGKIARCNPTALRFIGRTEQDLMGLQLEEIDHPLLKALAQIPNGTSRTVSITGVETFKCHKAHFINQGFPNYFLILEKLTNEKLEIERKAYSKVIQMMAHEVNNSVGPINSILDSLKFYRQHLPLEAADEMTEVLQVAIDRNEQLNQFMKNFATVVRLPLPNLSLTNVTQLIQKVVQFMKFETREKDIEFQLQLPTVPIWVRIDIQQIEQVLINIIKNAIEAIEKKGLIQVQVHQNPLSLKIIDNGSGISNEVYPGLFSPFFSTKKDAQGIGLTLTREILSNHHFDFMLETTADGLTTFTIQLIEEKIPEQVLQGS